MVRKSPIGNLLSAPEIVYWLLATRQAVCELWNCPMVSFSSPPAFESHQELSTHLIKWLLILSLKGLQHLHWLSIPTASILGLAPDNTFLPAWLHGTTANTWCIPKPLLNEPVQQNTHKISTLFVWSAVWCGPSQNQKFPVLRWPCLRAKIW